MKSVKDALLMWFSADLKGNNESLDAADFFLYVQFVLV